MNYRVRSLPLFAALVLAAMILPARHATAQVLVPRAQVDFVPWRCSINAVAVVGGVVDSAAINCDMEGSPTAAVIDTVEWIDTSAWIKGSALPVTTTTWLCSFFIFATSSVASTDTLFFAVDGSNDPTSTNIENAAAFSNVLPVTANDRLLSFNLAVNPTTATTLWANRYWRVRVKSDQTNASRFKQARFQVAYLKNPLAQ